jgi:malonate transporter and related proteins
MMAFGYAATFTRVFDEAAARALASFVYYFAVPVLLFRSMATTELPEHFAWGYLLSYYIGVALVWALAMAIGRLILEVPADQSAIHGFGAGFGNTVLLGIPLVLTAFGEPATVPLYLLLAFHSTVTYTAVTLLLETARGGARFGRTLVNALKGLATNPILCGLVAGILYNLTGLGLARAIDGWTALVAAAAVPCALFSVGAGLRAFRIRGALPAAMVMCAGKLILHPLLVYGLAVWVFAVPPLWTQVAVVIAALPVGVNVYVFANRYGVGQAEAASAILLSNLASLLTLSALLVALGVGG